MNISINGKPVVLSDDDLLEQGLNRIFRELYEQNEIVQEVIVDGTRYREDYNDRILNNLGTIRDLEIITVNGQLIASEITDELVGYVPKVIRAFDSISELFYGEMTRDDWHTVNQLLEGIGWVIQSVEVLNTRAEKTANAVQRATWQSFLVTVAGHLAELEGHLQQSDYTAAADLLKFEMPGAFETLLDSLKPGETA